MRILSITNHPVPARRAGPRLFLASLGAAVVLQGCVQRPPAHTPLPVYAIDQTGAAHTCTVSPLAPALTAGQPSSATMTLANDGGWCALAVHQGGPAPFTAGLLTTRAEHGKVYVHSVGDDTRIDYTPEQRFGGSDAFVVTLIPGDATVRVAASVAAPPEPPPAVVPPVAKSTPKKPLRKVRAKK